MDVPVRLLASEDSMPAPLTSPALDGLGHVLFFDTETIGLGNPVVCQLGYALHSQCGTCLRESNELLLLPAGARISCGAHKIHNISESDCHARGVDTVAHLRLLHQLALSVVKAGGLVVAHNAAFDVRAINATFSAFQVEDRFSASTFCLMRNATVYADCRNKLGRRKQPRNDELYRLLFDKEPEATLHDALADVRVTAANFFELRKRRIVVPPS